MFNTLNMLEKYALINAIKAIVAEPNREFSVRGLAKESGMSPGAAGAALAYTKKKGIARLKVIGRTHQYKANLGSPLCRQWKILFNLDLIEDSGLVANLAKRTPGILSILLYGSFAKGTNDKKSDIDILAIVQNPKGVKTDVGMAGGAEVKLLALCMADWKRKAAKEKVFYENVIYDSIVLYGERPVVL